MSLRIPPVNRVSCTECLSTKNHATAGRLQPRCEIEEFFLIMFVYYCLSSEKNILGIHHMECVMAHTVAAHYVSRYTVKILSVKLEMVNLYFVCAIHTSAELWVSGMYPSSRLDLSFEHPTNF